MKDLLKIKGLKVEFDSNGKRSVAVDGADLSLGENETVVLAGESGSGKTITALSITKILPKNAIITSGRIDLDGVDLVGLDEASLTNIRGSRVAYIFQEPTSFLNPVYTIGEQITEVLKVHLREDGGKARSRAKELLAMVRISDPEKTMLDFPHQLSGGMNQRVFIAMALASAPKILIADEPTTSLDVTIEKQILGLLVELKRELGFSLLFITHNLSIARRIADRICVMYKGKIVEEGSRESIFGSPKHAHTKELIRAYEKIGKI